MPIIDTVPGEALPTGAVEAGVGRGVHRSKLLLAATIEAAGMKSPARIRDLSETGALLEGPAFPPVNTVLTLTRLAMTINARVVWHAPPRCGVEFQGKIAIAEWISGKPGPVNFGQARVDAIQAAVRAETLPVADANTGGQLVDLSRLDVRIGTEIASVRKLLDAISAELSGDPDVVQQHGRMLQDFDLAGQILGHLEALLAAEDRLTAIKAIGMPELRSRLLHTGLT